MSRSVRLPFVLCLMPILLAPAACHGPGGALMPYTGATQSYPSSESMPQTVRLVDVRTGEVFFEKDIPPGEQLTFDFITGGGDDPVHTPDLMRWQLWPVGTKYGKLRNSMSVPNAASRRVDVYVRRGMEYAPTPPNEQYRTDQLQDRPAWWTPEGGPMSDDDKHIYDG